MVWQRPFGADWLRLARPQPNLDHRPTPHTARRPWSPAGTSTYVPSRRALCHTWDERCLPNTTDITSPAHRPGPEKHTAKLDTPLDLIPRLPRGRGSRHRHRRDDACIAGIVGRWPLGRRLGRRGRWAAGWKIRRSRDRGDGRRWCRRSAALLRSRNPIARRRRSAIFETSANSGSSRSARRRSNSVTAICGSFRIECGLRFVVHLLDDARKQASPYLIESGARSRRHRGLRLGGTEGSALTSAAIARCRVVLTSQRQKTEDLIAGDFAGVATGGRRMETIEHQQSFVIRRQVVELPGARQRSCPATTATTVSHATHEIATW